MRFKVLLAALLLALLASVSLAAAPDEGFHPRRGFLGWDHVSQFDEDGDGTVSREELERGFDLFSRLDTNGDGVLTEDDFAGRGGMRERSAMRMHRPFGFFLFAADADRDGEITQEEWSGFLAETDTDGDGVVDNLPFGPRHPPEEAVGDRISRLQEILDQDGDGQLETSDLQAIFAEHDANGDGALTQDELPRPPHHGPPGE